MKKAIASLLISFLGFSVQNYAAQQEGRPVIKQKVNKAEMRSAVSAYVFYRGGPQFSWIEGTSISYATNTPEVVLKIEDSFYFHYMEEVWLISASAQGPWAPAHTVPEDAIAVVCAQLNADPNEPYQLCALPWPS